MDSPRDCQFPLALQEVSLPKRTCTLMPNISHIIPASLLPVGLHSQVTHSDLQGSPVCGYYTIIISCTFTQGDKSKCIVCTCKTEFILVLLLIIVLFVFNYKPTFACPIFLPLRFCRNAFPHLWSQSKFLCSSHILFVH